ncbi:LuxR family transcriptional regulator [Streptomyces sp. SID13031]|uniref:helix-turn-helix transcriptional regulator n=1 Tax=Streptomyces sp. SID13031 TaxID=2706046 RepID=UPI0013CA428A|nr:LuxR family transcriptional regulator [Streptomyces sp. SID13031]NEA36851.1 AAA family ATPase [Streptomyces sp. SID13031]
MEGSAGFASARGLLGRNRECGFLDGVISAIRGGESRSLVLRGEAGIGKTALLQYLSASASDLAIVQAAGVESEMELAYASLHQLCAPLLDRLDTIPTPQRDALRIVFGLSAGPPPDRFLVGLAVLSLLSAASEQRPLLCVVDDAQWLDQASAQTLAFVARRLLAEQVGLVFAARDPGAHLQPIPALEVTGLPSDDARALLRSAVPFRLDEQVRDRIVAETRGNPLALLELPRGLTATQLAGGFGLLAAQAEPQTELQIEPRALTGRIEESFVRRLEALAEDSRRLLLVAAAEPIGDSLLLWRAAGRIGLGPAAAGGEEMQGLLAIGEQVTFRHPLVRSAVYGSAAPEERRAVHLALAEVTDRETDPDRRAWHLAAAAAGPDEEVAQELERSAGRAQARGGLAASAAFLRRALALTAEKDRRADRALAAAEATFQAGDFDAALGLLASAETADLDEFQSARGDLLRGHVAFASGLGSAAPPLLLKAARRLEPFDLDLARETYLMAWGSTGMAGEVSGVETRLEVCRAVQALPASPGEPRPLEVLLDGLARVTTGGHAAAATTLRQAAEVLTRIPVGDVLRWGWMATTASTMVFDFDCLHAISIRQVELVRESGALAQLPLYLSQLGIALPLMGDFAGTASLISELDSVAAAIGSPIAPYTLLRLRALQGREDDTSPLIAGAIELAAVSGQGMATVSANWAAAVLFNGLARYDEAVTAARQAASEIMNPITFMWVLPELVEAAARAGDPELAQETLDRLAKTTQPCGTDAALGIEARARAILSDGSTAAALYREAIERLGRTPLRPDLARAHLLYGEWLCQQNHQAQGREQLRTAYEMLAGMGMEAFAERARTELQAIGEKVRKRTVEAQDELTAQERQIAELARDGLSNPEIGARLFVSPRTVEWHLGNVFGKLGIRSRRQLTATLARPDRPAPPA